MSEVFSIRWRKEPDDNERRARQIIERWKADGTHVDNLFRAVIAYEGQEPVTNDSLVRELGQLAHQLQSSIRDMQQIDLTKVVIDHQTVMPSGSEFDDTFDAVMLSNWGEE